MPKLERNYKMKGVNFNLNNPAEKRLWDYACSISSFSGFVKHLLTNHLANGWDIDEVVKPKLKKETTEENQSVKSGSRFIF